MKNIAWFREVNAKHVGLVGGKGANLGELVNANFPVPAGFIVTSTAYFKFIEKTGIKWQILDKIDSISVDNTEQLESVTAEVRELIKKTKMDEELRNEILIAYSKLGEERLAWLTSSQQQYVAVRSSATAEDLPTASFAGQQETYLNIIGKEELIRAIKNCWASLFTARATYYRKKKGFKTEKVGIAVIVQKMVDSETSGVMFTADPTGDENKIIIEACYGLGEAIVSGSITPDTYVVDKGKMKILSIKPRYQQWKIVRKGKKNEKITLNEAKGAKQKIPEKRILEIAALGKQIEEHYGRPQDIEWAIEKGNIYIVQSRAITTLGLKEKVEMEKERRQKTGEIDAPVLADGLAASPGIASGRVMIVPTTKDIGKVKEGGVLVTKMTNPDWVPIMKKSSAIVTDEGGTTCHAAIVSRELGIPCVVGTSNATKKLKDGQLVTVNGYTGFVYKGEVKIDMPEKRVEKIIKLKEVDFLEEAIKIELNEKKKKKIPLKKIGKIVPLVPRGAGIKGMVRQIKEEKKEREKLREKLLNEKAKEETEKIERAEEEREKILEHEEKAWEIIEKYGEKKAEEMPEQEIKEEEEKLKQLLQEIAIKVKVNVALPEAAENAAKTGADGVGLLRAEHMITSSGMHPAEFIRMGREDELVQAVKEGIEKVVSKFKGKPVWYRTFDARSDEYRNLKGGEKEPVEENPMIGWHGIRRDLDEPELLKAQFLAIKKLTEKGHENIGIMLPFVISAEEVRKAMEIARKTGLDPQNGKVEFGVMVETPAAAMTIEELIETGIKFISFGTNDLTQLTLGIDRNNERIQKHFSEMHPAVLRLIERVIKKCKKAGVKTSICGQAASNPEMVKKLIRMGIDSVSANIDAVEEIKRVALLEEKAMILESLRRP